MVRALRIHERGGPEVLRVEDVPTPEPGPGQVRIRHTAIGVNFIDVYQRSGLYQVPLPAVLGQEAAGVIDALGPGVADFRVGDRVAMYTGEGAYAEMSVCAAGRVVKLPLGVQDDVAAAALVKGMTARVLLKVTRKVGPGDVIVWHAAAGGVGQIATQWAAKLGAMVIGVVGSEAKAEIAKAHGCAHVLVSGRDDIAQSVRALTNGEGAQVVYDSVGKDTFDASIDSLAPLGMLVSFGNASGPPPPVPGQLLASKGSLYFTRPTIVTYTRTPALLREHAGDLFDAIAHGIVAVERPYVYALSDAAQAHRDLEGRKTTGSLVLIP
ncbi:MAG: quinone oxidoreductase [Hyphomonadaceae bacterium]